MAVIMKGKDVVNALTDKIGLEIEQLKNQGIIPGLAIVRVGSNPDDLSYERNVLKKCESLKAHCQVYEFTESITHDEFINELLAINQDPQIHGALIFRPLPKQIDENSVKNSLHPDKDLDCITPVNVAKAFEGDEGGYYPCTAEAVIEMLDFYGLNLEGKNVVIVGRSMVVGKPLAMMMLKRNATVTVCHTKTRNLKEICRSAEVIVAAVGKARFITGDYVAEDSVILDVGINVDANGNLCGDVDFDAVQKKASFISPVPGGVGAVTATVLIKHLVRAAKKQKTYFSL